MRDGLADSVAHVLRASANCEPQSRRIHVLQDSPPADMDDSAKAERTIVPTSTATGDTTTSSSATDCEIQNKVLAKGDTTTFFFDPASSCIEPGCTLEGKGVKLVLHEKTETAGLKIAVTLLDKSVFPMPADGSTVRMAEDTARRAQIVHVQMLKDGEIQDRPPGKIPFDIHFDVPPFPKLALGPWPCEIVARVFDTRDKTWATGIPVILPDNVEYPNATNNTWCKDGGDPSKIAKERVMMRSMRNTDFDAVVVSCHGQMSWCLAPIGVFLTGEQADDPNREDGMAAFEDEKTGSLNPLYPVAGFMVIYWVGLVISFCYDKHADGETLRRREQTATKEGAKKMLRKTELKRQQTIADLAKTGSQVKRNSFADKQDRIKNRQEERAKETRNLIGGAGKGTFRKDKFARRSTTFDDDDGKGEAGKPSPKKTKAGTTGKKKAGVFQVGIVYNIVMKIRTGLKASSRRWTTADQSFLYPTTTARFISGRRLCMLA